MDDLKEKSIYLIIFLLIIVIIMGVALKSTESINNNILKGHKTKQPNSINTNDYIIENNNNQPNDISYYSHKNTKYYYSNDDKYYLILTENIRRYSNSSMGTVDRRYLLNIDEYYSTSSFTGTYNIENGKITLYVEAGCLGNDNKFNCVIPDGINLVKENNLNAMYLDYSENQIKFGNINLTIQN